MVDGLSSPDFSQLTVQVLLGRIRVAVIVLIGVLDLSRLKNIGDAGTREHLCEEKCDSQRRGGRTESEAPFSSPAIPFPGRAFQLVVDE